MTAYWVTVGANSAVLVLFGAFLMWRTRTALARRRDGIPPPTPGRVAQLNAEITRLTREVQSVQRAGRADS